MATDSISCFSRGSSVCIWIVLPTWVCTALEGNVSATEEAIRKGDITWHAFPHNAQLEIMSQSMIEAGFDLTFRLDEKFGLQKKRTLSQRDVPGMSRSIIPILKRIT